MAKKKMSKAAALRAKKEEEEKAEAMEVASTSSSEAEEEEAVAVAANDDGESSSGEEGSGSEQEGSGSGEGEGSSSEEEEGSDDEMDEDEPQPQSNDNIATSNDEQCIFDLSNLLALNTHQVNAAELYAKTTTKNDNSEWYAAIPTITPVSTKGSGIQMPHVNEALLLSKAAEGTTQLLAELWKLPSEKTDVGMLAKLPNASGEIKLPRSLPPPPQKKLTKWEEFALKRGIKDTGKNSRKVFDEATGDWKHLTGSMDSKANAGPESWPIMEVKKNDNPNDDPWEKLRQEKKSRVGKNVEARMRNAERSGALERGSANKLVKNNKRLDKQRDIAKEKELKRGLVAPIGIPSDFKSDAKRGKPSTQLALKATQVSTASLGKFDKQREGEPEKKHLSKSVHGKKRKMTDTNAGGGGTNKKFLQSEAQKSSDILNRVMTGGSSKEKERDVRKGKYAKGETGHDFEFDDGLGPGSFRKKKGRAGMGKMRKITKKRIK